MVYRVFNATLRPTLKQGGYKRAPGTQGTWAKPLQEGHLLVGVHPSKWGWDELTGSTIEFGFTWSPASSLAGEQFPHSISAGQAYGDDLLLELQTVVRGFAAARPALTEAEFYRNGFGNRSDWEVVSEMRKTPQLPDLQNSLRLPYYQLEHLDILAAWLAEHHATAERQSLAAIGQHEPGTR